MGNRADLRHIVLLNKLPYKNVSEQSSKLTKNNDNQNSAFFMYKVTNSKKNKLKWGDELYKSMQDIWTQIVNNFTEDEISEMEKKNIISGDKNFFGLQLKVLK